jgi:hypothetical protein
MKKAKGMAVHSRNCLVSSSLLFVAAACGFPHAHGQFSMLPGPLPKGSIFGQMETLVYPGFSGASVWTWKMPTITSGLDGKTDLTAGSSIINPASSGSPHLLLQAKRQIYEHQPSRISVAGGWLQLISFAREVSTQRDHYGYAFSTASRAIGSNTRLTAGWMHLVGRRRSFGESRGGALVSAEQRLPVRWWTKAPEDGWTINAQWVTGVHFLGYRNAGITFSRGRASYSVLYAAGTVPTANQGPYFAVSWRLR